MTKEQKQIIQRLVLALVVCVCASVYLSGVLEGVFSLTPTLNPLVIMGRFAQYGFPFSTFLWTFAALFVVVLFLMAQHCSEMGTVDKMGRLFKMTKTSKTYGEAHFEEPPEYEKAAVIQREPKAVGTILGQLDESGKYPIVFREDKENRLNRHIAIVGASGSGKTYTFSKNYAFQAVKRRESVILTDPDGGLYADMAGYFMDRGYIVRRFDLANLDKSDGWNCMKILTDDLDRAEENAEIFANIVISNITDPRTEGIYRDGPKSLLKALLLRVALGHDFKPQEKNIGSVYQLLQNPLGEEFLDSMFDASILLPEEKPCLGPYLSFKQASTNLRGNLLVNLAANLNVLQTKKVRTVLSTDCIDLSLPGKQPCAYFCVFPDSHTTYKFIVSLFFSMLFVTLTNNADAMRSRKLDVPVDFLLDEFPSIGVIPDFSNKMATIRKRMMNVCMIFQDITQLRRNYAESWATILSNCSTFIDLGINDADTADLVTKRIGDTTVQVETERHKPMETIFNNNKIFHQRSTGEGRRALVSFSELFSGLKENDSIIMFQYHNPILAKKYPHVLHSEAKYLRQIYLDEIPSIDDDAGREKFYAEQERIYQVYMEKHPHANDIDRTYTGMCESVPIKTVWEEWGDAFKALGRSLFSKEDSPDEDPYDEEEPPDEETSAEEFPLVAEAEEVQCEIVDAIYEVGLDDRGEGVPQTGVLAAEADVATPVQDTVQHEEGERAAHPDTTTAQEPGLAAPQRPVEPGCEPGESRGMEGVPEAVREAMERAKAAGPSRPKGGKAKPSELSPELLALKSLEDEPVPQFHRKTVPAKRDCTKPFMANASAPPKKRKVED